MSDQPAQHTDPSIIKRSAIRARHAGFLGLMLLVAAAVGLIILNGREPYGALPEP